MKALIHVLGILMVVQGIAFAGDMGREPGDFQSTIQDADGNSYRTVRIGDQIWLAENLRATRFREGTGVRTGFIPDDDERNLLKYGRLYDWNDVSDERNICPPGLASCIG